MIRAMTIDDYDPVIGLVRTTPGVTFRDADKKGAMARYLERNQGFSLVAGQNGKVNGCLLAGHDGRRGYLQHLIVIPECRNQGIAKAMINECLGKLAKVGIQKSHIDVLTDNDTAACFWVKQGWIKRDDICRYSYIVTGGANA